MWIKSNMGDGTDKRDTYLLLFVGSVLNIYMRKLSMEVLDYRLNSFSESHHAASHHFCFRLSGLRGHGSPRPVPQAQGSPPFPDSCH